MSLRTRIGVVVVLWVMSLAAVGLWAQARVPLSGARIISGPDLGFRVDKVEGTRVTGTLMIKLDGNWMPVGEGAGVRPLTMK